MNKEKQPTRPITDTPKARSRRSAIPEAKRGRGRPRKADKTTVKVVTEDESRNKQVPASAAVPTSVKPLAQAQAKKQKSVSHRPAKTTKPAVNVAQLENSLKEAVVAKAETEKRADQLESELKDARAENRLLQRTITRLQATIAELKAKDVKRSIWPWRRG